MHQTILALGFQIDARKGISLILAAIASLFVGILPARAQAERNGSVFEDVTLDGGFKPDPTILRGISGGEMEALEIVQIEETSLGPCTGYIAEEPDHIMTLEVYFNYLRLTVDSEDDTTLIVRGPSGVWCNDDERDMNPAIAGQWLSGSYEIWVGSYQEDGYFPYSLSISGVPLLNPVPFGR